MKLQGILTNSVFKHQGRLTLVLLGLFLHISTAFATPRLFTLDTHRHGQRLILDSFESENQQDLPSIREALKLRLAHIRAEHGPDLVLKLHIDETLRSQFETQEHLISFVEDLRKEIPVEVTYDHVPQHSLRVAYRKLQNSLMSHYRWSFTLVRAFAIGSASALSLKLSDGLPWDVAIASGVAGGFLSGNVQYWSKHLFAWMHSTSKLGAKIGTKLTSLLSQFGFPTASTEKDFGKDLVAWLERFGKWTGTEIVFVSLLCASLSTLGVEQDCSTSSVLWTSLLATFAQGTWDFAVTTTKNLKLLKGEREKDVDFFSQLSFLSIATVTTGVLTILKLLDIPFADMGFYAVGTGGVLTLIQSSIAKARLETKLRETGDTLRSHCEVELLIPAIR